MIIDRKTRIIAWLIALMVSCLAIELWIVCLRGTLTQDSSIKELTLYSADGGIQAHWQPVGAFNLQAIQIDVTDDFGAVVFSTQCAADINSFCFTQGEHGKAYHLGVTLILEDGTQSRQVRERAMFLNYDELPDIPFLNVETENHVQPTFTPVEPPKGSGGSDITDNDYVNAQVTMTDQGAQVLTGAGRIRVRGNSSTVAKKEKPYKLQMENPVDMLSSGEYAHTDWLLLPFRNLNFIAGSETALLCGMQWQPRYCLVNLMIGGNYLGTYLLTESVSKGTSRCDITDSGYIIELDAYWWNYDGVYFQTDQQDPRMGFTFKYPDEDSISVRRIENIKAYTNQAKHYISTNDPHYAEYIDVQSWADWLLIHDILGTKDAYGSNVYYTKYDYDPDNPTSSKLTMGPVWDFDSVFRRVDMWAYIRTINEDSEFPKLLLQEDFQKAYRKRWEQVYPTLCQDVVSLVTAWTDEMGQGLEDSLELSSVRWETERRNIENEIDAIEDWYASRVLWMNSQLNMD